MTDKDFTRHYWEEVAKAQRAGATAQVVVTEVQPAGAAWATTQRRIAVEDDGPLFVATRPTRILGGPIQRQSAAEDRVYDLDRFKHTLLVVSKPESGYCFFPIL